MTHLVSVIIPAYNAVETIIPCVKSVLNQTYKNLEIIVVDDGSTDMTKIILEEYKNEFCINSLQIIYQDNAGPSAARNLGIKLAKGEYIAFLDSDDVWYPQKIEKQMEIFIKKTSANIIGALLRRKGCTGDVFEVSVRELMYCNCFATSAVICRKYIFNTLQFNEEQKYSEDYRLWMEILFQYGGGFLLSDKLVAWANKRRFGESGLSAKLWEMEKGELSNYRYLLRKSIISFYSFIGASCWSLCKFLYRLSIKYMQIG